jgi:hypothetical protein
MKNPGEVAACRVRSVVPRLAEPKVWRGIFVLGFEAD